MADETNPTAPGLQTSEGKLTVIAFVVGTILEAVSGVLDRLQTSGQGAAWFPAVLAAIGVLLQVATFLGYTKSRTFIKAASIASETPSPK